MSERLRPIQRIQCPFEFTMVFDKGSSFRTPFLRFHYRKSARELSRVGLVVTRRVGNAVARNRVKRLLREVFRKHQGQLSEPFDVVLIPQGAPRSLLDYTDAFLKFLTRVGAVQTCAR